MPLPSALQALLRAEAAGTLAILDDDGHSLLLLTSLDVPVWARLVDAHTGQPYVHQFARGRELLKQPYLDMLGLDV